MGRNQSSGSSWMGVVVLLGMMATCTLFNAFQQGEQADDSASTLEPPTLDDPEAPDTGLFRSTVDETPGIAVAVLIDQSESMADTAPGSRTPKYALARDAVARVLEATTEHRRENPEIAVKVGLYPFSDGVSTALPIAPYDPAAVRAALDALPAPDGNTAIGEAMNAARKDLYASGATRKYILVVTDGENTWGVPPETVAREIRDRSEGGVGMYFVAFDVDPAKFAFVEEVGGEVLPAAGGAQLREALSEVYRKKILAEADGYGDGFAQAHDTVRDTATVESQP
ncbi:MAG TPA: vWA domain-containing protein [Longimicrobium sp.]|nr:vWA domain-containing protein [Longimicrobium sp.]